MLEEVAKHNKKEDCWQVIRGKVYDVTSYFSIHPGGITMLEGCGKEATVAFDSRTSGSGTPHSAAAQELLAQFYIGDLSVGGTTIKTKLPEKTAIENAVKKVLAESAPKDSTLLSVAISEHTTVLNFSFEVTKGGKESTLRLFQKISQALGTGGPPVTFLVEGVTLDQVIK